MSNEYDRNGVQPPRERLTLRLRSATLSEFTDANGVLRSFELSHRRTTQGAICVALAEVPGVRFEEGPASLWATPSTRFVFKNREYEVTIPTADIWVGPVAKSVSYRETEDLLALVKSHVLARIGRRIQSRFG